MQRTLPPLRLRLMPTRRIKWRLLGRRISFAFKLTLMLVMLWVLLSGCSTISTPSTPDVCPTIPPLPPEARQPVPPPICVPSCSAGLDRLLRELELLQTTPEQPASKPRTPTR